MRKRTIVIALACILGTGAIGLALHTHLVVSTHDHLVDLDDAPSRDVAIVLGAGLRRPGVPGSVLLDRLDLARELYEQGRVTKILVSGDNDGRGHDEVNPMRIWLEEQGVPSRDIYMDHAGFRTHDTMQRAAKVFEVDNAIICTQRFHLARSVYLARSAGIDAIGVAATEKRWKAHRYAQTRELMARLKAVVDVTFNLGPRYLGERIPIATSPATLTHDS